MNSTQYTLHTDFGRKILTSAADGTAWGVLSLFEIEEARERGEELTEWPGGVWVETHSRAPAFREKLLELCSEKKVDFVSFDDAGVAFKSIESARVAIEETENALREEEEA